MKSAWSTGLTLRRSADQKQVMQLTQRFPSERISLRRRFTMPFYHLGIALFYITATRRA
jgi:hypothetical protein